MIHRTYFSKDNTLYSSNPRANLGQDPIMELTYGGIYGNYSRVIFNFDIEEIKEKIKNMEILDNELQHYLVIYNSYAYDTKYRGKDPNYDEIPSSLRLELFLIKEDWDEGNGYSLKDSNNISINSHYSEQASSFLNSKTDKPWSTDFNDCIKEIIFDVGRENIRLNITELINENLNSNVIFNGLGLRFKDMEGKVTDHPFNICFFGKNTHTFFKPCVESVWKENIVDNRKDINLFGDNKIMLYPNIKGNPINLDQNPSKVTVYNEDGDLVFETDDIKQDYMGIYSYVMDGTLLSAHSQYTDTWEGIKYKGKDLPNTEKEIIIYSGNNVDYGSKGFKNNNYHSSDVKVSINGILHNEFINSSEKRRITATVEDFFGKLDKDISIDLYIKLGTNKIFLFENEPFIKTDCGKFKLLDFSWFTPQQYFIDVYLIDKDTRYFMETIKFNVISNQDKAVDAYSIGYHFLINNKEEFITDNTGAFIQVKAKTKD